jgi:predicted DNA-binding transcriptional regulator AlpA
VSALEPTPDIYLKAAQVRRRFGGVSDMWIHRRMRDAALPFPAPTHFGGLRFWRLVDLEAWESASKTAEHTPRLQVTGKRSQP